MVGDDERREVAARLRKTIGLTEFAEALGFNWADDSDWGWKDVSDIVADLIEPSCDRDALLALADEMTVEKGDIWRWSSRIREALGEVE